MSRPRHIAVIDVGKTNAKLALVEAATLREIAVVTRPNRVLAGPPWPHFDLEGHWAFFLEHLAAFQGAHGIDAISVTTHGAAAVLLEEDGALAAPMLDYEHPGPDTLAAAYDAIRPAFGQTGSPRLPLGLNLGAQLFWQFETCPGLRERTAHVLTYPQYWGYRLTGKMATDVTSLGCHTDLWEPETAQFSTLVERLGLAGKIAPAHRSSDMLGRLDAAIAARTGLSPEVPVVCGIHDSNASLYPHVLSQRGAFSVVSTGTWVVAMAMGGSPAALDPARDTLVNVNALGQPVPSARFMGGRAYEVIRDGSTATPTDADRAEVLSGVALLPSVTPDSGPFQGRRHGWTRSPATEGAKMLALSWYLALVTDTCLTLVGAEGPVIVEGPFGRNADYTGMLACLRPEGVRVATSATGTSIGAALLFEDRRSGDTRAIAPPADAEALRAYAARWQALTAPLPAQ
ncbi:FGGY-family carbohydrate kinase [Pseudooceanicola sp. CBS1P-1]|uniref:Carbohydrate kinase n=1 Tax=Pseudooceanicola albus TaxID=2692189 RepID=A0A6L7G624_9RHOB|nr:MULTISPECIES: FGGY-family carbohydrate kinase [Pseudooceanicola]MBT9386206.1 FGGY-family carbohydrate kinase [Pseudooceanicola endophyticus]MXN19379.1 carbohydrate kinase [Pseudooceanicola albus]